MKLKLKMSKKILAAKKRFDFSNATMFSHNEYKDILLNNLCIRHSMDRIQSKYHRIGTYEINKISLSCYDDKIYSEQWIWWISSWLSEFIRKNSYLNNYLSFLVKHFVSISSLISTAFLTTCKNIVRLLAWHIKFEKRKALKKWLNKELMPIVWYT